MVSPGARGGAAASRRIREQGGDGGKPEEHDVAAELQEARGGEPESDLTHTDYIDTHGY